ncbi:MAG TPA: formate dehydrogenase subunit gamma [Steroidobacteraceae bacterium]|nr:formate dehydrogenase subunit gamma [Steroidobacteraceae bacterium]
MKNTPARAPDAELRERIRKLAETFRGTPGPLLEVLHAVQRAVGYVPPAAVPVIAEALNLSRAEVHGVVTFYHHFRHTPPGRRVIRICRAEACQSMNAAGLLAHAQSRLGIGLHETTADGAFSLEPVYCLGNCACSPAVMIGEELHGRVTPQRFDELVTREGQGA